MMNKIDEIMQRYKSGEIDVAEANKQLKDAGAKFHLDPEKNPEGGWTQEEMEAGFIDPVEEAKPVQKELDMSRKMELAGRDDVVQVVRGQRYRCAYDEIGMFQKAIRTDD